MTERPVEDLAHGSLAGDAANTVIAADGSGGLKKIVMAAVGTLRFASEIQPTLALTSTLTTRALPSVTIPAGAIPAGTAINLVQAAISWRKAVDSSSLANAIAGATQDIQVRSDAPGTYIDAIDIIDNSLAVEADATEAGIFILGDIDVSGEVSAEDTYEFQWENSQVDGNSLTLHDLQTFLIVEIEAA